MILSSELINKLEKIDCKASENYKGFQMAGCGSRYSACPGCDYGCRGSCANRCQGGGRNSCPTGKNSGGGGGCFITTTVFLTLNKDDNCYELSTIRKFRDEFMKKNELMRNDIFEYYEISPRICNAIDKLDNREYEYKQIWKNWLKLALRYIENNNNNDAYRIYKEMMFSLKKRFFDNSIEI